MEKDKNFRDREGGRVMGGLILVSVGAALLLRRVGFFMPDWLFSWPMILILVGIFIGFKSNFRNNAWYIISLVGCYFLVSDFIPWLNLQPLFWPIAIIGLGILFILKPHRRHRWNEYTGDQYDKWRTVPGEPLQDPDKIVTTDSSDYLQVKSVFSGVNKKVVSKNFQGGNISCVFGGAEIDLSQADINGRVTIKLEMVFGGANLVVPPHWSIQNEIEGVFHGIEDKRRFNPSEAINPDKVLILTGSAVFGGMEIKSY